MHERLRGRVEAVAAELARVVAETAAAEHAAMEATDAATAADRRARLERHRLALLRAKRAELERIVAAGRKALAVGDH